MYWLDGLDGLSKENGRFQIEHSIRVINHSRCYNSPAQATVIPFSSYLWRSLHTTQDWMKKVEARRRRRLAGTLSKLNFQIIHTKLFAGGNKIYFNLLTRRTQNRSSSRDSWQKSLSRRRVMRRHAGDGVSQSA